MLFSDLPPLSPTRTEDLDDEFIATPSLSLIRSPHSSTTTLAPSRQSLWFTSSRSPPKSSPSSLKSCNSPTYQSSTNTQAVFHQHPGPRTSYFPSSSSFAESSSSSICSLPSSPSSSSSLPPSSPPFSPLPLSGRSSPSMSTSPSLPAACGAGGDCLSPSRRSSLLPYESEYHSSVKSRRISAPAGYYSPKLGNSSILPSVSPITHSPSITYPSSPSPTTTPTGHNIATPCHQHQPHRRPHMPDRHHPATSPFSFLRHQPLPSPVPTPRLVELCDGKTELAMEETVSKQTLETLTRARSSTVDGGEIDLLWN